MCESDGGATQSAGDVDGVELDDVSLEVEVDDEDDSLDGAGVDDEAVEPDLPLSVL